MMRNLMGRRAFLRVVGLSSSVAALAACGGAPAPAAEATTAPAEPTAAPAATTAPAVEAPASKFGQAPMLEEMVAAGTLPPVEERLPLEPLVVTPVHEVGAYGGDWKTVTTGSISGSARRAETSLMNLAPRSRQKAATVAL